MSLDTPFSVRTSPGEGATHLALAGRVDRDAEVELLAAWEAAVVTGARRVVSTSPRPPTSTPLAWRRSWRRSPTRRDVT